MKRILAAPATEWLPAVAATLGAPSPRRLPAPLARMLAGELTVRLMTTQRGALNAKAEAELGFRPEFPDWREGFAGLVGDRDEPAAATLERTA